MQTRKQTAYRKSRKFGDVYGGRVRQKIPDNIFQRAHSVSRPGPLDELPIVMRDNPSRDFFFPVMPEEALQALKKLPQRDVETITHLWFRRVNKRDYGEGTVPFAEFCCGSGVRMVVLYPWPTTLRLNYGTTRPPASTLNWLAQWTRDLVNDNGTWFLHWTEDAVRAFYLEHLLLHEIGHNVDWYRRRWTKANRRNAESFADDYATFWSSDAPGAESMSAPG